MTLDLTLRQRAGWLAHVFKAATQQHHAELLPALRPYIPDDGVVCDVGAHAGQFAKLFARLAPKGVVHAFEPSSYTLSVLDAGLRFNGLKHVQVHPYGLSDAPGRFTLSTPLKRGRAEVGYGLAHLGTDDDPRPMRTESIEVRRLDDVAAGWERLDFLKADVEGWEMRMLTGARETLTRFKPTLLLELAGYSMARAGDTPQTAFELLQSLGYKAARLLGDGETEPTESFAGDCDYIFTR